MTDLEPIQKLTKDLKKAAALLSPDEARFLVDSYYQMQGDRIRSNNQVRAVSGTAEPHETLAWLATNSDILERNIKSALDTYGDAHLVGRWSKGITGIGPVISAGLLANIDLEPWHCGVAKANPKKKACRAEKPHGGPACARGKTVTVGQIWRFCLPPGTKVNTPDGYVSIETLAPGAIVYDRRGQETVVTATAARLFTGIMVTLKAVSAPPLRCTGNHPVWIVRHGTSEPEWVEADDVEVGDHMFMPRLQERPSSAPIWKASARARGKQPLLAGHLLLNTETAWTLGRYAADGSACIYREGRSIRGAVNISIGYGKVADLPRVRSGMAQLFGSARVSDNGTEFQVCGGRRWAAENMRTWFGRNAKEKRVPAWIYGAAPEIVREFINGFLSGDGCDTLHRGRFRANHASSASSALILGIQRLSAGIGVQANVNLQLRDPNEVPDGIVQTTIRGRTVASQNARWTLNISGRGCALLDGDIVQASPYENHRVTSNDEGSWCPIIGVSREAVVETPVYDLETAAASFVAVNVAVHNSGLDPTVTWAKGQKRPWNDSLKVLCWKIGESFVKVSGHKDDFYGKLYLQRKAYELRRNLAGDLSDQATAKLAHFKIGKDTDARVWYSGQLTVEDAQTYYDTPSEHRLGLATRLAKAHPDLAGVPMLPPAHIHARAQRWTVKLFLAHWHAVAYKAHFGEDAPKPYVLTQLHHAHEIKTPNWPF